MKRALVFICSLVLVSYQVMADTVLVAVSSNMSHAMQDISEAFSQQTDIS